MGDRGPFPVTPGGLQGGAGPLRFLGAEIQLGGGAVWPRIGAAWRRLVRGDVRGRPRTGLRSMPTRGNRGSRRAERPPSASGSERSAFLAAAAGCWSAGGRGCDGVGVGRCGAGPGAHGRVPRRGHRLGRRRWPARAAASAGAARPGTAQQRRRPIGGDHHAQPDEEGDGRRASWPRALSAAMEGRTVAWRSACALAAEVAAGGASGGRGRLQTAAGAAALAAGVGVLAVVVADLAAAAVAAVASGRSQHAAAGFDLGAARASQSWLQRLGLDRLRLGFDLRRGRRLRRRRDRGDDGRHGNGLGRPPVRARRASCCVPGCGDLGGVGPWRRIPSRWRLEMRTLSWSIAVSQSEKKSIHWRVANS